MTSSSFLNFFFALFLSCAVALRPCELDPNKRKPICDHPLRYGYCHTPPAYDDPKWCTWEEQSVDVCCTSSDTLCCDQAVPPTRLRIGATPIILVSLCCCLALFCRVTAELPFSFRAFVFQIASRFLPQSTMNRWALRDRERAAGLPRGSLAPFVFPELPPLDLHKGKECVVCCEAERGTVLPCGHSSMCEKCCHLLLAQNRPCPHCRKPFCNFALATAQPSFRDFDQGTSTENKSTATREDNSSAAPDSIDDNSNNGNQSRSNNNSDENSNKEVVRSVVVVLPDTATSEPPRSPISLRQQLSSSSSPDL